MCQSEHKLNRKMYKTINLLPLVAVLAVCACAGQSRPVTRADTGALSFIQVGASSTANLKAAALEVRTGLDWHIRATHDIAADATSARSPIGLL